MSRVELAVEKVRRLNENQAEALLDWLGLRENRDAFVNGWIPKLIRACSS